MSSLAFGLASYLGGEPPLQTATFAQLSLAVQQLGQWENSDDVTPAVLLQAINFALLEGYDIVVQKWLDYYTIEHDSVLTAEQSAYALTDVAPGFYKLRHIDFTGDTTTSESTKWTPMLPHEIAGAHAYSGRAVSGRRPPRYRVQGQFLMLTPTPSAGIIRTFYIPVPYQFSAVDDTNQVVFDAPIEMRLVVQLAQRDILERSDLSTADCDRKIERLTALLRTAADSRDAGTPFYLNPLGPPREPDWAIDDEGWWV